MDTIVILVNSVLIWSGFNTSSTINALSIVYNSIGQISQLYDLFLLAVTGMYFIYIYLTLILSINS